MLSTFTVSKGKQYLVPYLENRYKIWYYSLYYRRVFLVHHRRRCAFLHGEDPVLYEKIRKQVLVMKIIKRSGTEMNFDAKKITAAISKANREVPAKDRLSRFVRRSDYE